MAAINLTIFQCPRNISAMFHNFFIRSKGQSKEIEIIHYLNFLRAKQALLKIQLMSNYSWSKLNFQQLNYDIQINYLIIISMSSSLSRFLNIWNSSYILKFQSFSSVLAKFKRDNSDKRVGYLNFQMSENWISENLHMYEPNIFKITYSDVEKGIPKFSKLPCMVLSNIPRLLWARAPAPNSYILILPQNSDFNKRFFFLENW